MTSISDQGRVPQAAAGTSTPMPGAVRWALPLALGALMTGAPYLVVVRGEALLMDLAALGERLWCF